MLDLNTLKIDRSLFQNESDTRERILVRHIVETAKELEMKVIAEGVETKGLREHPKGIGCDYIQGFVFYKPMPAEEFEQRFIIGNEKAEI